MIVNIPDFLIPYNEEDGYYDDVVPQKIRA